MHHSVHPGLQGKVHGIGGERGCGCSHTQTASLIGDCRKFFEVHLRRCPFQQVQLGGYLDGVRAKRNLFAHRAAAVIRAVASGRGFEQSLDFRAEPASQLAATGLNDFPGNLHAGAWNLTLVNRIANGEHRQAMAAHVPDSGKSGLQRVFGMNGCLQSKVSFRPLRHADR